MRQLLALLATRIRRSTGHIEDLVFLDLPGRVAKLLIDQSELFGSNVVSLTQEDLASFVGATRVAFDEGDFVSAFKQIARHVVTDRATADDDHIHL